MKQDFDRRHFFGSMAGIAVIAAGDPIALWTPHLSLGAYLDCAGLRVIGTEGSLDKSGEWIITLRLDRGLVIKVYNPANDIDAKTVHSLAQTPQAAWELIRLSPKTTIAFSSDPGEIELDDASGSITPHRFEE